MPESPYPIEVRRLPESRRLRLTWNTGVVDEATYDELRGWCPCAGCQGHDVVKLVFHPPQSDVSIDQILPVGNYALSFGFSDGHATGIYRYELLRSIASGELERDRAHPTRKGSHD